MRAWVGSGPSSVLLAASTRASCAGGCARTSPASNGSRRPPSGPAGLPGFRRCGGARHRRCSTGVPSGSPERGPSDGLPVPRFRRRPGALVAAPPVPSAGGGPVRTRSADTDADSPPDGRTPTDRMCPWRLTPRSLCSSRMRGRGGQSLFYVWLCSVLRCRMIFLRSWIRRRPSRWTRTVCSSQPPYSACSVMICRAASRVVPAGRFTVR